MTSIRDHSAARFSIEYASSKADKIVWSSGIQLQHQRAEFDSRIDVQFGALAAPLQSAPRKTAARFIRRDGKQVGLFVSALLSLSERWQAELGLRHDSQDVDPVHTRQWSPRLELRYGQGSPFSAYLNLGRYTQHQQLYDLQVDDGLIQLAKPQLADQLSIGFTWSPKIAWEFRADAYMRDTDDPRTRSENVSNRWVLHPELHADRVQLSPSKARAYGLDTSIVYSPTDTARVHFSWSLAKTQERVAGRWQPRPWDQRHALRLGADWEGARWQFAALAHYHSGWPTSALRTTASQPLYDTELPGFLSVDLSAARRWHVDNTEVEAYLSVSNTTQRDNVGGYVYQQSTRTARKLLPAVPTIGVRISW